MVETILYSKPKKLGRFAVTLLMVSAVIIGNLWPVLTRAATDTSYSNYVSGQYYGKLVSDADFTAVNSMSVQDIQNFLASQGSYLATAPSSQLGEGANGQSAAQIIWNAAHATYSDAQGTLNGITISQSTGTISPRAIMVTLQKEQGLITNGSYDQRALDCAMGYEGGNGCSWMIANHPSWAGFTHQVGWASWQLRYNYEAAGQNAAWWTSHYGSQSAYYVGYSRSHYSAHDGNYYIVTYQNQATAALYRYTPYVSNGNYNFWRFMISWFGVGTVGGTVTAQTVNDTDELTQTTYRSSIKFTGTKSSDVTVFYNGNQVAGLNTTSWTATVPTLVGAHDYYVVYYNNTGGYVAQKKISITRHVQGDVNGDGVVDILDVSLMAGSWGQTVKDDTSVNLNPDADSTVDLLDFSILASNFGKAE